MSQYADVAVRTLVNSIIVTNTTRKSAHKVTHVRLKFNLYVHIIFLLKYYENNLSFKINSFAQRISTYKVTMAT